MEIRAEVGGEGVEMDWKEEIISLVIVSTSVALKGSNRIKRYVQAHFGD